jgi:hypothetical protein
MGLAGEAAKLPALKAALPQTKPLRTAGGIALLAWVAGLVVGSNTLKNMGIGAGMAVLATQHFQNQEKPVIEVVDVTNEPLPTLQGW